MNQRITNQYDVDTFDADPILSAHRPPRTLSMHDGMVTLIGGLIGDTMIVIDRDPRGACCEPGWSVDGPAGATLNVEVMPMLPSGRICLRCRKGIGAGNYCDGCAFSMFGRR